LANQKAKKGIKKGGNALKGDLEKKIRTWGCTRANRLDEQKK